MSAIEKSAKTKRRYRCPVAECDRSVFKLANHLQRVHGMSKATARVLYDETLRPHRIESSASRRRLRLCLQCNRQYRRLDIHLLETHAMPTDNVGVLLADERKKNMPTKRHGRVERSFMMHNQ